MNPEFIKFAKEKYMSKNKVFEVRDITKTRYRKNEFDKSMYISMLHHFSDRENLKILHELAKITRGYILIIDIWPSKNPIRRLFQKIDRGDYIRSVNEQKRLIEQCFNISLFKHFYTKTHHNSHSLFIVRPKKKFREDNL